MTYCTNCGKQNTQQFNDKNGHPYELEDDLSKWGIIVKENTT